MGEAGPVIHDEVEQVLDPGDQIVSLKLERNQRSRGAFRDVCVLLFVYFGMGVFVLLPLVEQQSLNRIKLAEEFEHKRTCRIHLPVLFISHHNFPVSDIVFTDYRVLVQLEYDHIVKAGNVDLNLPEVVKIIALPLAREWHVPLSELPVQVVERHKVTLIHQSEVGPQLDHLCCAVNKHLSLHVGLASTRQHPRDCRQCTPNIRL